MSYVVVLNDGETYTSLEGCVVLNIPDDIDEGDVDVYVKEHSIQGQPIDERMAKP